jgi:predicted ATPase
VAALLDTEPHRLDKAFQEAFYKHTQGHALFAVEMLRGLQERGDLVQDVAGQWVEGSELNWETLPARVEGVIGDRITRLPTKLQKVLEVASVEGEVFTAEVVAQVQEVDEREMVRQLSGELDKQHRLIVGQGSQRMGPRRLSHYRFRHILFQRYLYNTLDEVERGYLHEAVANELEQLYGQQTGHIAGELARHFESTGLFDKAVSYLQQAGDRAVRLSANEEALAHFYKGLALLETMPETLEHQRQELTLQIALYAPLAATRGYGAPEVGQAYARARTLCEQVGEPDQLFQVLYGLWGHNLVIAQLESARELAEQCLGLAQQLQEPALLMEAYRILDETTFHRGEFVPARKYLEKSLSLYDPGQHRAHAALYGQDPGAALLSHGAWILWHLGYPDQALKMGQEAVALGEDSSHPFSLAYALCYTAVLHQLCQEEQMTEELATTAVTLSTEQGLVLWLAMATILRGWTLAARGQRKEGIAQMRQGLTDYQATGTGLSLPYLLALLAEEYMKEGRAEESLATLGEALAVIDRGGERHYEAELYRLKGKLLLETGEAEVEAEANLLRAIHIARQQDAKSLELRAAVSLCRLWQGQGKKEEARRMLAEIFNWFTEGFNTGDLNEAKALIEKLSASKN